MLKLMFCHHILLPFQPNFIDMWFLSPKLVHYHQRNQNQKVLFLFLQTPDKFQVSKFFILLSFQLIDNF
jgi:hypothetical protein